MATMKIPAALHEVTSFNFRHSIGPSFGLLIDAWRLVFCVETDMNSGEVFLPMPAPL
jgi:hypothetical protein